MRFFIIVGLCFLATCGANGAEQNIITAKQNPPAAAETEVPGGIDPDGYRDLSTFIFVMQLLREHYVDDDKISYRNLFQGALKGMLGGLDRFSSYQSPEEFTRTLNSNQGSFVGIGVILSFRNKSLRIENVEYGSPADRAGLREGDVIVSIDGKDVKSMSVQACLDMIKGKAGSMVKLKCYRETDKKYYEQEMTREVINAPAIPAHGVHFVADGIGYVRVNQFSMSLNEDLDFALSKLERNKLQALIIDLRGNPGGLLLTAVRFCSNFLPAGKLIVEVKGRNKAENAVYKSGSVNNPLLNIPLVILVDGGSASASEIVAGCLQDCTSKGVTKAIIIGEQTFGKGSVQTILPLGNNTAIKLTTARYYTPKGRSIQAKGI
ncbi:MAG: S41 family peptidase, partial [Victivallales bacterium]|nr:S41 family peptidase [Victivallales bacterium]